MSLGLKVKELAARKGGTGSSKGRNWQLEGYEQAAP